MSAIQGSAVTLVSSMTAQRIRVLRMACLRASKVSCERAHRALYQPYTKLIMYEIWDIPCKMPTPVCICDQLEDAQLESKLNVRADASILAACCTACLRSL